jgi:hypothetical protein
MPVSVIALVDTGDSRHEHERAMSFGESLDGEFAISPQ